MFQGEGYQSKSYVTVRLETQHNFHNVDPRLFGLSSLHGTVYYRESLTSGTVICVCMCVCFVACVCVCVRPNPVDDDVAAVVVVNFVYVCGFKK